MLDPKELSLEELVRRGRIGLRSGQYEVANACLSEYCDRQLRDNQPISGPLLADYALAVAHTGDSKEASQICLSALAHEKKNPDVYAALARIHGMSGSRRKAVDAIDRGLALSPRHPGLLAVQQDLGVRRPPPIPFLSRDNPWNVWLGRVMGRVRPRRGTRVA